MTQIVKFNRIEQSEECSLSRGNKVVSIRYYW